MPDIVKGLYKAWRYIAPQCLGGDPWDYGSGQKANTDQCAKYANGVLRENGKKQVGDAWRQYADKGYAMQNIINGEEYTKNAKPKEYKQKDVYDWLSASADSLAAHLNPADVQDFDSVSMYYKQSPNQEKAYKQGTTGSNTHTGFIRKINGVPYVEHNVGGQIKLFKLEDILGGGKNYGVTQIRRVVKK
jgi:hypothetical protein